MDEMLALLLPKCIDGTCHVMSRQRGNRATYCDVLGEMLVGLRLLVLAATAG